MTTQSKEGGCGGHHGSPRVRTFHPPGLLGSTPLLSASSQAAGAGVNPSGLSSASQQVWKCYASIILAAGAPTRTPSCTSSAVGPTISAPSSDRGTDDRDTEMCHQTPYPNNFMAELTLLRLIGNYCVAEQKTEAISATLLTTTTWFQTMSRRPDVFEGMFIAPKLKERIFTLAQAADRHLIF